MRAQPIRRRRNSHQSVMSTLISVCGISGPGRNHWRSAPSPRARALPASGNHLRRMLTRLTHTLALAFGIAAVLTLTALTRADVDLWGHLRFGLDILETRSLHSVDPYSFTSDRPWLNHEWLAEVVIALAW